MESLAKAQALTIAIVEDYEPLLDWMGTLLRAQGHTIISASSSEDLTEIMAGRRFDLLIVDVGLPGEDGLTYALRIRKAHPLVGIIVISGRDGPSDREISYRSGADTYLTKPVTAEEVVAAVTSLARRVVLGVGQLRHSSADATLCIATRSLESQGGSARLTHDEVGVLVAFMRTPYRQLETWQILEIIDKDLNTYSFSALEVRMVRLRQKLTLAGLPANALKKERGGAYSLSVELTVL